MIVCVTDRKLCKGNFLYTVERACERAGMVILREKDLDEDEYCRLAAEVAEICRRKGVKFCVNKFPGAARENPGAALQLSFGDFCRYAAENSLFCETGVSVHSVTEAVQAEKLGADFLIAGHIFETQCKRDLPPRGIGFLEEVVTSVKIPVYAIGGIKSGNLETVLSAGAAGACMMSEMMN